MKKNVFYLTALAAVSATMMTSCINDENETSAGQNGEVISLTASMASETTRAKSADNLQDTQFASGKSINVEAYKTTESTIYDTKTYSVTDAAGNMSGTMTYPATGEAVDFCAYYPSDITSSSSTFSVGATQKTEAQYQNYDLMYATKLIGKTKGTTHELTFNHALSKVIVNIVNGTGVTTANITSLVTAVKINGTVLNANLNISNGVITATKGTGSATDIDITGTGASNIGVIVPQEVAAGTFITVTYNGNDYTYALPSAKTFVAANSYTYTLTLNAASISLKSEQINPWTADIGDTKDIIL